MRILEAMLAALVLMITITIAMNMMKAPSPLSSKGKNELTQFGYDFLIKLTDAQLLDEVMFERGTMRQGWEERMKVLINSMIPANLFYNMTIYNTTYVEHFDFGDPVLVKINTVQITNTGSASFTEGLEVASADAIYTTQNFRVLRIHLDLVNVGQRGRGLRSERDQLVR